MKNKSNIFSVFQFPVKLSHSEGVESSCKKHKDGNPCALKFNGCYVTANIDFNGSSLTATIKYILSYLTEKVNIFQFT